MSKTPRIPIPLEVKQWVFERDRHQCQSCGATPPAVKLTLDHIIPLATGGTNDVSNFQTLCDRCNSRKQHRFDPRFQQYFDL
jgi:5-methylcytosine-specific restriction enzyme A